MSLRQAPTARDPLVMFGPRKLPQLGKGLGEAIRGFKDAFAGSPTEKKDEDVPKQITK
jgi:TatA/E family protein of Tat protein translocase